MPVPSSNVDAETPVSLQGDIEESPMPAPNATSRRVSAAAATAPAATAGHETPEVASMAVTAARSVVSGYVVASIKNAPLFSRFNSAVCGKFRHLKVGIPTRVQ